MKILLVFLLLNSTLKLHAQVGIGTPTASTNAVLELSSTNRGLLLPRLTSTQIAGIVGVTEGLIVYNTEYKEFWGYTTGGVSKAVDQPIGVQYSSVYPGNDIGQSF